MLEYKCNNAFPAPFPSLLLLVPPALLFSPPTGTRAPLPGQVSEAALLVAHNGRVQLEASLALALTPTLARPLSLILTMNPRALEP